MVSAVRANVFFIGVRYALRISATVPNLSHRGHHLIFDICSAVYSAPARTTAGPYNFQK